MHLFLFFLSSPSSSSAASCNSRDVSWSRLHRSFFVCLIFFNIFFFLDKSFYQVLGPPNSELWGKARLGLSTAVCLQTTLSPSLKSVGKGRAHPCSLYSVGAESPPHTWLSSHPCRALCAHHHHHHGRSSPPCPHLLPHSPLLAHLPLSIPSSSAAASERPSLTTSREVGFWSLLSSLCLE